MYLCHIGSFVPAEAAKVGVMDGIFTRVQTRESISIAQSAFLIDINQVRLNNNNIMHLHCMWVYLYTAQTTLHVSKKVISVPEVYYFLKPR